VVKTQVHIKFTVTDYRNLPESETRRCELLGGDIVMVPSPSFKHQSIAAALFGFLERFVKEGRLGIVRFAPLDVIFSDEDVAQPDLLFISNERSKIIQEDAIHGAPDLIVEILSPSTAERDRTYKRTLYARSGVSEYWLVEPETYTVEVLTLEQNGYHQAGRYQRGQTLGSPLLAGLAVPLNEIF